jgi:Na+/melibiose symporter-like transporter
VLPQLLELPKATGFGLGRSMLVAGLCLGPSGLVMMLVSPLSARLSAAKGPKVSFLVGSIVIAAGYGLGIAFMSQVWHLIVVSSVIGAGIGLAYAAMPALIMSAVPQSETAAANGLNTLMRAIGTSTSSAVAGLVLAHLVIQVGDVNLPSEAAFRLSLVIGCAAALAAFLIALLLPRRSA